VVVTTRYGTTTKEIGASVVRGNRSSGLKIKGLYYTRENAQIFQDFSFESSASLIVLRGASGCGKTTLLKILSGHIEPTSAEEIPDPAGSCLVLQEDSLLPWMTGVENITKLTKLSHEQIQTHAMYQLISPFVDRKAFRLSYGQRRMIELFRAFIHEPPYLYLDEPFNFLDEGNIKAIAPFIVALSKHGTTVVLSNHHQEDTEIVQSADVYKFDGRFPVFEITQLR
jgi:ABC-type multidrug transport system ATPase subunit